jgi:hypothetical protein
MLDFATYDESGGTSTEVCEVKNSIFTYEVPVT